MRIGVTYDRIDCRPAALCVTPGQDMEHAQTGEPRASREALSAVCMALEHAGHQVVTIGHVRDLVDKLAAGDRWDLVLNTCVDNDASARSLQVSSICDAFQIPCVLSGASAKSVCMDRIVRMVDTAIARLRENANDEASNVHFKQPHFVAAQARATTSP